MIPRTILQKTVLLIAVSLLAACSPGAETPAVDEILVQPDTSLMPGETAALTISASGTNLMFEWRVNRGSLSNPTQPVVVYTAPSSPGPDIVTVKVAYDGGEIIRSVTFEIIEPATPTATATAVPQDTPTVISEPISCDSPAVTRNLFPQLEDVNGQFAMYGPPADTRFRCKAIYDIVHNEPLAVHIKFQSTDKNFGWWGIATPVGYDASVYGEICFWAYAQQPNQSFRLKMKDTALKEDGVIIILEEPNQWKQICTDLAEFSDLGIKLDSLDNINLGFEQTTGSAEIWIADFEFK